MMKFLAKLWFRISGWTVDMNVPEEVKRCVCLAAPHTSNYDAWLMLGGFGIAKVPIHFAIKKDWVRFPIRRMTRRLGAVPIDRSPKVPGQERRSMTEVMTELFDKYKELTLVIAPEGTRSLAKKWRTGFYWVAKNAGVPICMCFCDYKNKHTGVTKVIWPTDFEKDMREIMEFYAQFAPRYPEKFALDERYV